MEYQHLQTTKKTMFLILATGNAIPNKHKLKCEGILNYLLEMPR